MNPPIKKNGIKVDGKQNYQCKDCKRQFIGDHALSYLGCKSGITRKILQLMVRGSGIRDIAEVERISIGKVLRTLTESTYEIQPQQSHYESLEVDEFWNFVGNKKNKQWLIFVQKSYFTSEKPDIFIGENIGHCCKVSDEAAFCLIQRPYVSKTLLTRRISPRGS
ncbi:IS1 family transposase, partial [Acinetobacter baumannii]